MNAYSHKAVRNAGVVNNLPKGTDLGDVRLYFLPFLGALLLPVVALGQSHPTWWTYTSPDATALVGIHWSVVNASPFGEAVLEELSTDGLGFPQLDCLLGAEQILVSAPEVLAVAYGSFSPAAVARDAREAGMAAASYKGSTLWINPDKRGLSVGQWSNQILFVGQRKSIEEALDRARSALPQEESRETTAAKKPDARKYSPLLSRAARFNGAADLWVVASRLPDPLASRFVPFMVEARGFDGGVSLADGLQVEATVSAGTRLAAGAMEDRLRQSFEDLPVLFRNAEIHTEQDRVAVTLAVTGEQLSASLRGSKEPVAAASASAPPQLPAAPDIPIAPQAPQMAAATVVQTVPPPPPQIPDSAKGPRVIRIVGLDEGPLEIPYTPSAKKD
jgi:hypothetical protein